MPAERFGFEIGKVGEHGDCGAQGPDIEDFVVAHGTIILDGFVHALAEGINIGAAVLNSGAGQDFLKGIGATCALDRDEKFFNLQLNFLGQSGDFWLGGKVFAQVIHTDVGQAPVIADGGEVEELPAEKFGSLFGDIGKAKKAAADFFVFEGREAFVVSEPFDGALRGGDEVFDDFVVFFELGFFKKVEEGELGIAGLEGAEEAVDLGLGGWWDFNVAVGRFQSGGFDLGGFDPVFLGRKRRKEGEGVGSRKEREFLKSHNGQGCGGRGARAATKYSGNEFFESGVGFAEGFTVGEGDEVEIQFSEL